MNYVSYQHIEKLGSSEVDGILNGTVYIQSKLDGTNSCLWLGSDGQVHAGSRKREISELSDNQGFAANIATQPKYAEFFKQYPNVMLYGEYLIKNHIKNYEPTAYKEFYVFDIVNENGEYVLWDEIPNMVEPFDIKYIPVIAKLENPTEDEVASYIDKGRFCCTEETNQEGIVIKNATYRNEYGRQTWAKIISNEYKVQKTIPNSISKESVEVQIVEYFCTTAFIEKEYDKIVLESNGWNSKLIPRVLNTIWHEFIVEESWNFIKKYHNPTIDYKVLNKLVTEKVKSVYKW